MRQYVLKFSAEFEPLQALWDLLAQGTVIVMVTSAIAYRRNSGESAKS